MSVNKVLALWVLGVVCVGWLGVVLLAAISVAKAEVLAAIAKKPEAGGVE